jgi:hypothetical protein
MCSICSDDDDLYTRRQAFYLSSSETVFYDVVAVD